MLACRLTYPFHDRDVLVTACGRICIYRKKINLNQVFAGQRVGIKEVDDGIWIVSFMRYDLGYIDLEARTLQPLDNPFGPRLSRRHAQRHHPFQAANRHSDTRAGHTICAFEPAEGCTLLLARRVGICGP